MAAYASQELLPYPLGSVWELLRLHLDDQKIHEIHSLVLDQRTVRTEGTSLLVERTIDVRAKRATSSWRITYEPPRRARWEILESTGPWLPGSWLENTYTETPGGTTIDTRAEMTIVGLPFFLSQRKWVAKVMDQISSEDLAFLAKK